MVEQGQDQDRSEQATPYKLQKARERGSVARGIDLGFLGGLVALGAFVVLAGEAMIATLAQTMRRTFAADIAAAGDPATMLRAVSTSYGAALHPVLLFGATVLAVIVLLEIVQLRGLVFSPYPLKPDFQRLNPAAGFKRLFSLRLLKEALKSIVKMALYATAAVLLIRATLNDHGGAIGDALTLADALRAAGMKLLWTFALVAAFVAALDQFITRRDFAKQMRMSRRDVTREAREREGDPRLKRKRKETHAAFAAQTRAAGALPGSDMVVVNPQHFAVALAYDRSRHAAPVVSAKARDRRALMMKRRAAQLNIPIFAHPALARALHAAYEPGAEIGEEHYHAVAALYLRLAGNGSGDAAAAGEGAA